MANAIEIDPPASSTTDGIDSSTAAGPMVIGVLASMAALVMSAVGVAHCDEGFGL